MRGQSWIIHCSWTWRHYLSLTLGAIMTPKREQRRQKTAITLLDPRHPNLSTRPEAMGAKRNVPTPEPQTQTPVAKLSLLVKYWPTATTAGTYIRPSPIPRQHLSMHLNTSQYICAGLRQNYWACQPLKHFLLTSEDSVTYEKDGETGGVAGEEDGDGGHDGPSDAGHPSAESRECL